MDAAAGSQQSSDFGDIYPPAIMGPASNTEWDLVLGDRTRFERLVAESYGGDVEQTGTNWIRLRWHHAERVWRRCLDGPVARLRAFDASAECFSDAEIAKALLDVVDENRSGDEKVNRARLSRHRPRATSSRLRPNLRLKALCREWKAGNEPRPEMAGEYEATIDDIIDFAGDPAISVIDADMLYDYRDEAAKLPASMPRADRALPFTARVAKHEGASPKCTPPTLKKRVGVLQALLTYAFQQRWTATNVGSGIRIAGYSKNEADAPQLRGSRARDPLRIRALHRSRLVEQQAPDQRRHGVLDLPALHYDGCEVEPSLCRRAVGRRDILQLAASL